MGLLTPNLRSILDHMTQNLVCPEFWFHEVYDAKAKATKENNSMMHNADVLLLEEAHRVSIERGEEDLGKM